jgi:hypothetical protein
MRGGRAFSSPPSSPVFSPTDVSSIPLPLPLSTLLSIALLAAGQLAKPTVVPLPPTPSLAPPSPAKAVSTAAAPSPPSLSRTASTSAPRTVPAAAPRRAFLAASVRGSRLSRRKRRSFRRLGRRVELLEGLPVRAPLTRVSVERPKTPVPPPK